MAPLKKIFSHDGVTHELTILVMAPLNLDNFVRVQDYVGRVMANPSSHGGDCSRHKKSAARNGDSPLRYAPYRLSPPTSRLDYFCIPFSLHFEERIETVQNELKKTILSFSNSAR